MYKIYTQNFHLENLLLFLLLFHHKNAEKLKIMLITSRAVFSIKNLWLTIINNSKQNTFCDMAAELISDYRGLPTLFHYFSRDI
jgi:hypothetical protein